MTAVSRLAAIGGSLAVAASLGLLWWKIRSGRKSLVGVVTKLVIYPIKSCGGVELSEALCTPSGLSSGLLRDRQFMVVEASNGEFVSARAQPSLVLVSTNISEDGSSLVINAPGMEQLTIDLSSPGSGVLPSNVWGDDVQAGLCESAASDWFSQYLKMSVRLVYFDPSVSSRQVEPIQGQMFNRNKRPKEENAVTMFADGYPYLLCTEESVDKINADIGEETVGWKNFRPNILMSGCQAYAEDAWRNVDINGAKLFNEKLCARCRLPNVNPSTGVVNSRAEPFNTLYKTRSLVYEGKKYPMFGVNLILDGEDTVIKVGQQVFAC